MELILWRHAEAEDDDGRGDLERALTKKGHRQAKLMADWLRPRLREDEWRILVSPATRATETVAPLDRDYAVVEEIAPGASARDVLRAAGWPDNAHNIVVVGHQPTLGEVASLLLMGEEGSAGMRKGGIWWFEAKGREGRIRAVLSPDMVDARELP